MNENSTYPGSGSSAEAISRRAYQLWEQEGRPEGNDLHHWLRAERELNSVPTASESPARHEAGERLREMPDTRPLQPPRSDTAPSRNGRRASKSPFAGEVPNASVPLGSKSDSAARRRA